MAKQAQMTLEIRTPVSAIEPLGNLTPVPLDGSARQVFIDGKQCPKGLADIILFGLDAKMNIYLDELEASETHWLGRWYYSVTRRRNGRR